VDSKKVTRRLKEVPPGSMDEVLRVAAELHTRDQGEIARTEERRKLVEATEEAGLPAEYLERAARVVLARRRSRVRRRLRGTMLAALGLAMTLGLAYGLWFPPPREHAAPASVTPPAASSTPVAPVEAREVAEQRRLEGAHWSPTAAAGGITPVAVGDGMPLFVTREGSRCLTTRPATTPPSIYLYFDIGDARTQGLAGPIYLAVEFFDALPSGRLALQYDSALGDELADKYRGAEEGSGAAYLGTGTWRTAYFLLRQPRFAGRQNNHTDFRFAIDGLPLSQARKGWPLFLRALRLTRTQPEEWVRDG
jgi:hypothetical protein